MPAPVAFESKDDCEATYTIERHIPPTVRRTQQRRVQADLERTVDLIAATTPPTPASPTPQPFRSSALKSHGPTGHSQTTPGAPTTQSHTHRPTNILAATRMERLTLMERALTFQHKPVRQRPPVVKAIRLIALEDGTMFGTWTDGVSMIMHPQATTMTQMLPDGTMCRQVSALVGSAAKGKLVELLAFRNMICEQPVLDEAFWSGETHKSASAFPFARWGLQPASALNTTGVQTDTLDRTRACIADAPTVICPAQRMADGSVRIEALEGGISLTLLPNGNWVRLSYPLPLKRLVAGVMNEGVMKYEYTYANFSQLFPIDAVPSRWKFPLQCALMVASQPPTEPLMEPQQPSSRASPIQETNHLSTILPPHLSVSPIRLRQHGEEQDDSFNLTAPLTPLYSVPPSQQQQTVQPVASHFDLIMDLPVVRSLQPSSIAGPPKIPLARAFVEPAGPRQWEQPNADLSWPDNPGHSLSLMHSNHGTLPKNSLIKCVWTPSALHWIDHATAEGKVISLVHEDQSALVLQPNGFIHHFLEPLTQADLDRAHASLGPDAIIQPHAPLGLVREKLYATNSVPFTHNTSGLNIGEKTYPLAEIAEKMLQLKKHASGVLEQRACDAVEAQRKLKILAESQPGFSELTQQELTELSIRPEDLPKSDFENTFSSSIVDKSLVRGLGEFTAFRDGRIKCKFFDRCILEMNAARTEVNMLLPNGFPLYVSLPSKEEKEYERYIRPTLEFAQWAYMTPTERAEQQRKQQLQQEMIQFETERIKRFLALQRMARGEITSLKDAEERENQTNQSSMYQHTIPSTTCTPVGQNHSLYTRVEGYQRQLHVPSSSQGQHSVSGVHCTPSILPSFVVHNASGTTSQPCSVNASANTSPLRYIPSEHDDAPPLPSFLSPIAGPPTFDGAENATSSFLQDTPTAPLPPIPSMVATPSVNDVSYWLNDLKLRNHAMKQKLVVQQTSTRTCTETHTLSVHRI